MGTAWSSKFKDMRWQKVRLKVFERAGWRCVVCGADDDRELQVHHGYYAKGREPWEYDEDSLWALCDECHVEAERIRKAIPELTGQVPPQHHAAMMKALRALIADGDQLTGTNGD